MRPQGPHPEPVMDRLRCDHQLAGMAHARKPRPFDVSDEERALVAPHPTRPLNARAARRRAPTVGVRPDRAGVHRKALAADRTRGLDRATLPPASAGTPSQPPPPSTGRFPTQSAQCRRSARRPQPVEADVAWVACSMPLCAGTVEKVRAGASLAGCRGELRNPVPGAARRRNGTVAAVSAALRRPSIPARFDEFAGRRVFRRNPPEAVAR